MPQYPSMKARELRRVLEGQTLGYVVERQKGSHAVLVSEKGYPRLVWAFHDGQTLPPGLVRTILKNQVGLSDEDAFALL